MDKKINKLFQSVYRMIKVNALFVLLSLSGLVVFGVGPALISVKEVNSFYFEKNEKLTLDTLYREHFFTNFIKGNILFYAWFFIMTLICYNIFLGVQVKSIVMLGIVLFLIVLCAFVMVFGYFLFEIASKYDISIKDNFKLSLFKLLSSLVTTVKLLVITVFVVYISTLYKGLFLFLTFGGLIYISSKILAPTMISIDQDLHHETR